MADHASVSFKSGVNCYGLHPRVWSAMVLCAEIVYQTAGKECVFTSLCDGVHSPNSYHYLLGAFDARTRHLTAEEQEGVAQRLARKLDNQWDVVLESDHLHVEVEIREDLEEYLRKEAESVAEEMNRQLGGG